MKNYNSTLQGATIDTSNKKQGNASAKFTGTDNANTPYIDITDLPGSLTDQGVLSFSFWFRSNATLIWGRIFDFGNGAASNNIIAYINNNNLGLSVYGGTNGNINTNSQFDNIYSAVNDNVWRHCVWVLDGTTWRVYINGSLNTTKTGARFPTSINRTINYIGKSNWADNGYNGNIDDFRIYKEALTQEKVTIIYNYK